MAIKIGNEQFDAALWREFFYLVSRRGEVIGTTVGKIVPRNGGDYHISQPEVANGQSDPPRFTRIDRLRSTVLNSTKVAISSADIAKNKKGRRSAVEAFTDVGTGSLDTNSV
jgi:hypothetical protein